MVVDDFGAVGGRGGVVAELIPEGAGGRFGGGALALLVQFPRDRHRAADDTGAQPDCDEGARTEDHDGVSANRPQREHVHQQMNGRDVRDGVREEGPVAPRAQVVEVQDEVFGEQFAGGEVLTLRLVGGVVRVGEYGGAGCE